MVRAAGTTAATGSLSDLPEPTWGSMLRRGLPQFGGEAVVPVLVFYAAWRLGGLAVAIVASSIVYLVLAGWVARLGRDTGLIAISASFVVIQAVVGLVSHSATVYLAQPVVLSALWGVAYLGSVAIGRPLVGVLANVWYPFPPWFRAGRPYRREFAMQSLVWGAFCLVRAALRLWALLESGVGGFVVVSLLTGTPVMVALVAWSIWHAKRAFARLELADAAHSNG